MGRLKTEELLPSPPRLLAATHRASGIIYMFEQMRALGSFYVLAVDAPTGALIALSQCLMAKWD